MVRLAQLRCPGCGAAIVDTYAMLNHYLRSSKCFDACFEYWDFIDIGYKMFMATKTLHVQIASEVEDGVQRPVYLVCGLHPNGEIGTMDVYDSATKAQNWIEMFVNRSKIAVLSGDNEGDV